MVLNADGAAGRIHQLADAVLRNWSEEQLEGVPPIEVRNAVREVRDASRRGEEVLSPALENFIAIIPDALSQDVPWGGEAIGVLLRGLYSIARQHQHSPAAKAVIGLCDEVRVAVEQRGAIARHPNELLAALMVVEDATCAVEGYEAVAPFAHVDEGYLAKYGLLQALQVGFDGAEAVGEALGVELRADRQSGGKSVKVTRNIVAGHPIGGNMDGESWHHFHDRATAHDDSVIRVMSFSRKDPEHWTGQTIMTSELIADGLDVMAELLRRSLRAYMEQTPGD